MRDDLAGFPPRTRETVRVDSIDEERAYLNAYPSPSGPWQVVAQTLEADGQAPVDRLTLRAGDSGLEAEVRFDVGSFVGTPGLVRLGGYTTEHLDRLIRAAGDFAREHPPAHPGELPRFPVPSVGYPGRVDVPIVILAVDAGRRGLYAPPRVVTLDYRRGEPYGIGAFPGFDPEDWPPPRVGDWPPPALARLDRLQIAGMIARFSACATRILDAWLDGADYPYLADDMAEVRRLWPVLDPPGMEPSYAALNPAYAAWLGGWAA